MDIEGTSFYNEVMSVIKSGNKQINSSVTLTIRVTDAGIAVPVLKVLSVDVLRDFELNYADESMVKVTIGAGTYMSKIYPYKNNLEIDLLITPLLEGSSDLWGGVAKKFKTYKAILQDIGDLSLQQNSGKQMDEETLNRTNLIDIEFQLITTVSEQVRTQQLDVILRNCTVEDAIKSILTSTTNLVKSDSRAGIFGVDMVPASNTQVRDHLVVESGTRLIDLPVYFHLKCGGVYSAGIGSYLQDNYWYVYPCYDVSRFNSAGKTLTVINVPSARFPNIERTYRADGNNVVVLATGDVLLTDDTEAAQLQDGNGVRFTNANAMMEGFTTTKDNKTLASRGDVNNEFLASNRSDGVNFAPVSRNGIHANVFLEHSKLARKAGSIVQLVWENSAPELITPGMPVKLLYQVNDGVRTLYGTVLKCHDYVHMNGQGFNSSRYSTRTALALFVRNS